MANLSRMRWALRIDNDRRKLIFFLPPVLIGALAMNVDSSTLTLTTIYPAPSGIYKQLVTTGGSGNTILSRDYANVGIGTTNPPAKLTVLAPLTGVGQSSSTAIVFQVLDGNSRPTLSAFGNIDGTGFPDGVASAVQIREQSGTGRSLTLAGSLAVGGGGAGGAGTVSSYFQGKVGIATTAPSYKLHVLGDANTWAIAGIANASGNSYGVYGQAYGGGLGVEGWNPSGAYGYLGGPGSGVYGYGAPANWSLVGQGYTASTSYGVLGYGYGGGGIGVEGYNPTTGTYGLLGYSSLGVYGVSGAGQGNWAGYFVGDYGLYAQNYAGYYAELGNGGYSLLGNGDVCGFSGAVCFSWWYSDARLKRDIKELPESMGLDSVLKLRPVSFRWRDDKRDAAQGEKFGFIAQEAEKIVPRLVRTYSESEKIKTAEGPESIESPKSFLYQDLEASLVKSIQQLHGQMEELRRRNETLEKEVAVLIADRHASAGERGARPVGRAAFGGESATPRSSRE